MRRKTVTLIAFGALNDMTEHNQKKLKRLAISLLFYLVAGLLIVWGGKLAPSGPCTPGLDVLGILFGGALSLALCIKNVVQLFLGDQTRQYSLVLHSLISISWLLLITGVRF